MPDPPGSRASPQPATPPSHVGASNGDADLGRRLAAELFGTFALVFVAVGADAMATLVPGQISPAARAVAPGLMVAALIYAIGDVSGAHLNPVVTLAFAMKRLFPVARVPPYWLSQLAGALLAAAVVGILFGAGLEAGVSTPHVAEPVALAIEAILTTLLVLVILGTAERARIIGPNAALAVAATIILAGLIALPVEGSSMNPARSLAPAIVTGRLDAAWIYLLGPVLGSALAVTIDTLLHGPARPDPPTVEAAQGR
jgi:aquaporin Z